MEELRQVRTLRLGASRLEQVSRTAIALEDALRTASLPPLPRGAILLVRRLDLGRLPANASPQWLSRHIETRLRALQLAAIRPSDEAPATAPAVWFADRSEALAALLTASLHHTSQAWYWPGVLPGWRPGMAMRELLPLALAHAGADTESSAGTAAIAALLTRLLRRNRLDDVLAHLEPDHLASTAAPPPAPVRAMIPALQQPEPTSDAPHAAEASATIEAEAPSGAPDPPAQAIVVADAAWHRLLVRWVRRWGQADRRSHWLARHALVAVHGPAAARQAAPLVTHLSELAASSRAAFREAPTVRQEMPPRQPAARTTSHPAATESQAGGLRPPLAAETARRIEPSLPRKASSGIPADAAPQVEPDWQASRFGGLLLLLPAIDRLDIAAAAPEGDLCLHLLHRIADRFAIRDDDAIRRALPKPLPRTEPWSFAPPDAWRGLLRLPRRLDLSRENHVLAACQLALARYLYRYARISPRRLLRRPALVHATPTHIDLRFDRRWVELEVRLAGLDLDPGWVPWLGRVVTFHYDYEGQP